MSLFINIELQICMTSNLFRICPSLAVSESYVTQNPGGENAENNEMEFLIGVETFSPQPAFTRPVSYFSVES